jgi:ATP-dependent protease HslVU (ClpYQ) peptidase subunit
VWLAGDSAANLGSDRTVTNIRKVWKQGPYLFGLSGDPRTAQILRYATTMPAPGESEDLMAFMCTTFVDTLRGASKKAGHAKKDDERESLDGSTFLACLSGRIFKVEGNYQIGERADGIDAIGCGNAYALGSLHTTAELGWEPNRRLGAALAAAARFSTGVCGPFSFICSEDEEQDAAREQLEAASA